MTIIAIIVAAVFAFLAFRFIKGIIKFGLIAIIVIFVIWFLAAHGVAR
jgi:hypothetical protein